MRKTVTLVALAILLSNVASAQTKPRRAMKVKLSPASADSSAASSAEVERIFQRFADALGDPRALRSVRSFVMRGILEVPEYGLHGTVEVYGKEPDRKLTVVNLPGRLGQRIEAVNGESGWGQTPFSQAFDLKRSADADRMDGEGVSSLAIRKNYTRLSVKGKMNVAGREVVMIAATRAGGQQLVLYFDTQSGLLVRIDAAPKSKGDEHGPSISYFEGFAKVDGVVVPTVIRETGKEFSVVTRFYEVKFNVHIEDSLFERPKAAQPDAKSDSDK